MSEKKSTRDEHAGGLFVPHGHLEVWAEGRILHYCGHGPFNMELLEALDRTDRAMMQALALSGPFAIIAEIRESVLATPDALAALEASLAEQQRLGLASTAVAYIITPDVEGCQLMTAIFSRIYAAQQLAFRVFDNQAAARQWVETQLAACR